MTARERSVVRALAKTPMRDLARGRLTGRLDPRVVAEEADLPDALADLVVNVSRLTRLKSLERSDVAHELASHFREGLDAGRTPEELTKDFGDAKQAAKLIRRGKKRTRGLVHKVWARGWQAIGLTFSLMIVLYAIHAVRFHLGEPTISVDYLAKINAPALAVPEEERAWPIYEKAIAAYVEAPEDLNVTELRPDDERWGEVVAHVHANADSLEMVRRAASKESMEFVVPLAEVDADDLFSGAMITALLPHLGGLQSTATLLATDTRVAIHEGDSERAEENLRAMVRLAEHSAHPGFLISQLVGYSIMSMGIDTTTRILDESSEALDSTEWTTLAHTYAAYLNGGRVTVDLSLERDLFYDVLQRMYSDDGDGDGRLTWEGLMLFALLEDDPQPSIVDRESPAAKVMAAIAMPAVDVVVAGRAETRREYDRIMDMEQMLANTPSWDRDEMDDVRDLRTGTSTARYYARYPLIAVLLPALQRVTHAADRVTMRRDATLVSIALELHRREHGTFPESLDELVPALLPSVPRDMIDGQPMRYSRTDDSYTLYSIGADGDDDGGRPALEKDGDWDRSVRIRAETDGDWVLFPPEPRKEPKEDSLRQ